MASITNKVAPDARLDRRGMGERRAGGTGPSQRPPNDTDALPLPSWVFSHVDRAPGEPVAQVGLRRVEVRRGAARALVTVQVANAAGLEPLALQRETIEAYRQIAEVLQDSEARFPVRFWNFVPGIGCAAADRMDRYMVFNAGRFAAYLDWYGDVNAFDRCVATATGIGHDGDDLVIHTLAARRPGVQIMNPRQQPPRCYSQCYGPFPPCFARATVVAAADRQRGMQVLIGGTAAVCGERSMHADDVHGQTWETLRNLEQLIEAAGRIGADGAAAGAAASTDPWRCFRSLRVYMRRAADEALLRAMVGERFAHLTNVEFLRADICRPELLVEIEGTAEVPGALP